MSKHIDKLEDISEALEKGSKIHKKQSEQLEGASKLHKNQSDELEDIVEDLRDNRMATGGITKGKSHAEGGIPMEVKSTGQKVELEGGEGVINKKNMADKKLHSFEGKEMTKCEIASEINSDGGNGVEIDCDGVTGKKYKHEDGGKLNTQENPKKLKPKSDTTQEDFEKVWSKFKRDTANRFGGKPRKKLGGSIEEEIDKMQRGGNVAKDLSDYHNRLKRKGKRRKFVNGGMLQDGLRNKQKVMFVFKTPSTYDAFDTHKYNDTGTYSFDDNTFYQMDFYMFDKKSNEVYLEVRNNETIVVSRDDIRVEHYDFPDMSNDFASLSYENYKNLTEVDKEIIEMLNRNSADTMTTDQIEFLSYFKGNNVANHLTNLMIEQMYSYVYENKAGDMEIKNIYIHNNGCGNVLALAPRQSRISVLSNNNLIKPSNGYSFAPIEMTINDILNSSRFNNYEIISNAEDIDFIVIDAMLFVREMTNPIGHPEISYFVSEKYKKQIAVCVSEFYSKYDLDRYVEKQKAKYEKKFGNQIKGIKSIVINKGITERGTHTLYSIIKKGF